MTFAKRVALAVVLVVVALRPAVEQGRQITVTLLGTGCPPAVMNRFGPSTLVEAGGQKFVFDAGRGALQRLTQLDTRSGTTNMMTHLAQAYQADIDVRIENDGVARDGVKIVAHEIAEKLGAGIHS